MTNDSDLIATLQQENAELKQQLAAFDQKLALLEAIIENSPSNISVIDRDKRIVYINRVGAETMDMTSDQLIGVTQYELFGDEVVSEWDESDRQVIEQVQALSVENRMPLPDGDHFFLSIKFPMVDANNYVYAIGSIVTDITEQKRLEEARLNLQQEIIDAQQAALRELSTPLVPIAEGVVAMPLVGAINAQRAQQIIETLLEGISERQAETAILDITGVKVVDTQVAQALLRAAQAAQLLGAQVVITGIGAEVAQSLVQLGADLSRIVTRNNLQSGIAYALESTV